MKNKKLKNAFSLIELSIVILIIGIIVAGVTQSSSLVRKMRLRTAQALTQSSPVNGIKDVVLWLETTSDESFDSSVDSGSSSANSVQNWYDISINTIKSNATAPSASTQPKLVENAINGLPALLFDGTNDILKNTTLYTESSLSIFAVATNNAGNGYRRIISGNTDLIFYLGTGSGVANFAAFYSTGSAWTSLANFGSSAALLHPSVATIVESILSGTSNNGYLNGTSVGTNSQTKKAGAYGYAVGSYSLDSAVQPWGGYIAEIIIFNRALPTEEREEVEKYLGKKWGIKVS